MTSRRGMQSTMGWITQNSFWNAIATVTFQRWPGNRASALWVDCCHCVSGLSCHRDEPVCKQTLLPSHTLALPSSYGRMTQHKSLPADADSQLPNSETQTSSIYKIPGLCYSALAAQRDLDSDHHLCGQETFYFRQCCGLCSPFPPGWQKVWLVVRRRDPGQGWPSFGKFANIVWTTHNSSYPPVSMASSTNTGKGKSDGLRGCQFSSLVPLHVFRCSTPFLSIWVRDILRPFFKSYGFTTWNLALMRPPGSISKAISLWTHKYGAKNRIKQYGHP